MTKSEKAVATVLKRLQADPRLAYIMGPFTQSYEELTEAYAETIGKDVEQFRLEFEKTLRFEKVAPSQI